MHELTVGVVTKFVDVEAVLARSQAGQSGFNGGRSILGFLSEDNGTSDGRITTNNSNSLNHLFDSKKEMEEKEG